jgi:uncharacterized BrkB/YihY/UPF0761 family membrane protein
MVSATRSRSDALRDFGRRAADLAETRVPGAPAVVESLERERAAGSALLAGGVAYRFFLWLLPLGLVLAAVASFWAEADPDGMDGAARRLGLAAASASSARTAIETGAHSRWYMLAVGVPLLLWFGIGAVRGLRVAHAIAWAERITKLREPLYASLLFTGIVVGLLAFGGVARWIDRSTGGGVAVIVALALFVVYVAVGAGVMMVLPHGAARWPDVLPGAAIVAIGNQLLHLFVVVYLVPKLGRSSDLYGALGAATVILLWLYLVARLLISAAFFNATLWDRRHARE